MKTYPDKSTSSFVQQVQQHHAVFCFLLDLIPEVRPQDGWPAAFARAGFFSRNLGCTPVIFTHLYQSRGSDNARRLAVEEKIPGLRVLNLYDTLQEIDSSVQPVDEQQREPLLADGWKTEDVPDTHDIRIIDQSGRCVVYRRSLPDDGGTDCINFISPSGGISRRDTFDVRGFMSRTEFIDEKDGSSFSQIYYRPDHSVALTESYGKNDRGERVMFAAELMNRQGHCTHRFFSHEALVAWWLGSLLRDAQCSYVLVADRPHSYLQALRTLRRRNDATLKVMVPVGDRSCSMGELKELLDTEEACPEVISVTDPDALRTQLDGILPEQIRLLRTSEDYSAAQEQIAWWGTLMDVLFGSTGNSAKTRTK